MPNDPKILALSIFFGIVPSVLWLFFWLSEDKDHPEPKGVLASVFFLGMMSVVFVLPVQKLILSLVSNYNLQIIFWATAEEIIKYLAVVIIVRKTFLIDEPVDWPIYLITSALGFAALENAMFLLKPLSLNEATVGILTGQLRFVGSTLLHTISSGILGVALGLSMIKNKAKQKIYFLLGLLLAISLHSVFNFFIMNGAEDNVMKTLAFLWITAVVIMLLFEKLRRLSGQF